jgi:hypothetical protein
LPFHLLGGMMMRTFPVLLAGFFVMLAVVFLVLAATRRTPQAKLAWRRIGIIFAAVGLIVLVAGRTG